METGVKTSPIGTLKYSVEEVGYSVKTVIQSLGMLFTGKIGFDSLLGPCRNCQHNE